LDFEFEIYFVSSPNWRVTNLRYKKNGSNPTRFNGQMLYVRDEYEKCVVEKVVFYNLGTSDVNILIDQNKNYCL
jgi:hypothetical protein